MMGGSTITISWFRSLAAKGGKGTLNNIDARSLGRIADELEAKDAEIVRLRAKSQRYRGIAEELEFRDDPQLGARDAEIVRLREQLFCAEKRQELDVDTIARLSDTNCDHGVTIARLRRELAMALARAEKAESDYDDRKEDDLRAELTAEAEQSKICLDSYAAENQRLSDERDAARQDAERMREALDNSQGLLVAMLLESRPQDEIERQIVENRAALQGATAADPAVPS
jgi:hypothetical protein